MYNQIYKIKSYLLKLGLRRMSKRILTLCDFGTSVVISLIDYYVTTILHISGSNI